MPLERSKRFDMVNEGQVDLYCSHIANTKKSAEKINFSINFFVANIVLVTSKQSGIEHYGMLANQTIAITKGTAADRILSKNQPRLKHKTHYSKNLSESIQLLNQGEVQGVLTDDFMGLAAIGMIADEPNDWVLAGKPLDKKHYSCLMAKGDTEFKAQVDAALLDLIHSRRIDRIYDKWFNQPIPPRGINFEQPFMHQSLEELLRQPSDEAL